jgi:hypothetical protein
MSALTVGSIARHNATLDAQQHPEIVGSHASKTSHHLSRGPSVKGVQAGSRRDRWQLGVPMRIQDGQWRQVDKGAECINNHGFIGNTIFKEVSGTSLAAPYIASGWTPAQRKYLNRQLTCMGNAGESCGATQ